MKKLFIIANWKSNKTQLQAQEWFDAFSQFSFSEEKEVIVCPTFTLLPIVNKMVSTLHLPIRIGAQNISSFDAGSFTGEVNAEQIKELGEYVIIGHSERRNLLHESNEVIAQKVERARAVDLIPLLCVPDEQTSVPADVKLVAYEPVAAIGTGKADSPENANSVAKNIKQVYGVETVIYGGSVTAENVHSFSEQEHISGFLVGKASLDPKSFQALIQNA